MNAKPKFAVVTGAAGGIGQAIVREFAAAGYHVIGTDRVPEPHDLPLADYIEADLARTVNDDAYAAEVFGRIRSRLGSNGLAALINNAAVQILGGVDTLSREDWHTTLDVNLLAPFIWAQALLPELEASGGSVVNISSIHARLTKKGFVAYATSKAALSGMTRAMAVDLAARVRVNAIEPAAIDTLMLRAGFADRHEKLVSLERFHPSRRIGTPAEVARLCAALARSDLGFLNGCIVGLDGGIASVLHDPE